MLPDGDVLDCMKERNHGGFFHETTLFSREGIPLRLVWEVDMNQSTPERNSDGSAKQA